MSGRLQDVILRGVAASKPLATAVAKGTLYFSTDTLVTEQSDGAAWNSYSPTGADAVGLLSMKVFSGSAPVTFNVNSTTYIGSLFAFEWSVDMAVFPFTEYRILLSGGSSAAGQTVTLQATVTGAPTVPLHTGGDDLVLAFAGTLYDSGWKTRDTVNTGLVSYILAAKGSNSTVDIAATYVQIMMKL